MDLRRCLSSLICLVACDPILDDPQGGGSTSGSTGALSSSGQDDPIAPSTQTGEGSTSTQTTGTTVVATTSTTGWSSTSVGETGASSTSTTGSGSTTATGEDGSTTDAGTSTGGSSTTGASESSSTSGDPPELPDGVAPDWTLTIDGFDGYALEVLDDGRIAVGGQEDDTAVIHIVDPSGALGSSHPIDPALWDAAPSSERVLEIERLDGERLAVLVSRGASNVYSIYDGVLEFDVSPGSFGDIGWSALLEGVVLADEPDFFEESHPGVTEQLVTTSEGELYVAGRAFIDQTTTLYPEYDSLVFWVQRLDPGSGESLWWHSSYLFDGLINCDVEYWLFVNDAFDRVLLQANDWNKSSGYCFWRELAPGTGELMLTDVSLGTDYEYCWPATEFSDGTIGAPAGILIAGAHDVHVASPGGVTEHPLAPTHFGDATRIYLDGDDRTYLEGRIEGYDADGLGRVELSTPATSQLLVSWPSTGFLDPSPLRDVAFGLDDEVLTLRDVDGVTVLEQRTLE